MAITIPLFCWMGKRIATSYDTQPHISNNNRFMIIVIFSLYLRVKLNNHMKNPFVTNGYVSPEYFCDREKETAKIVSLLTNENNIALISPRRLG